MATANPQDVTPPADPASGGASDGNISPETSILEGPTFKRGIASGSEVRPALSPEDLKILSPNVTWWYNWSPTPGSQALADASAELNMEFVPMVFTGPFDADAIDRAILPQSRHLLGFNEPNFDQQGHLTPAQAAALWPAIERIADKHNLKIVSPALNFCGGACNETDPMAWFDAFFAACPDCRVDYLALHAYVCYGSALASVYIEPFYKKYGKKIWLTEFSCLDGSADANDPAQQQRYMKEAVTILEKDPRIYRYAWFLARTSDATLPISILDPQGNLTQLGLIYKKLATVAQNLSH